eukprot:9316669-Heterocapsa_arctica.AAC.1
MAAGKVHLCREAPCGCAAESDYHVTCFAAVDPGEHVDVHEVVDRGAYIWMVGRMAAFVYHA